MSNVSNIDELRRRKEDLRAQLDQGLDNPFEGLMSTITKFSKGKGGSGYNIFDKNENSRNELMDESVKAILTLVASAAVTRFRLGGIPKLILTAGVALATPFVVDKIQQRFRSNQ
ncbi:MAG: hypothetical protein Q4F57_04870 [Weeksellaceae bacterium]|nr:hypothetical protein [Weeksellaceae bacterium]